MANEHVVEDDVVAAATTLALALLNYEHQVAAKSE
jgi:hypothetical protein